MWFSPDSLLYKLHWLSFGSSVEVRAGRAVQERDALVEHLTLRPSAMWRTGTIWSFRNEARMYGSPMFDRVLAAGDPAVVDPMASVLAALQAGPSPAWPLSIHFLSWTNPPPPSPPVVSIVS